MDEKKLIVQTNGSSKIDIDKIDLSTQSRMFTGGVDNNPAESVLTKGIFEKMLKKIARPLEPQGGEGKSKTSE